MAFNHEFFILSDLDNENLTFDCPVHECILNDYLIVYMWDTLNWVPTLSYNQRKQMGLNYEGITIIQGQGLTQLKNILESWYNLFSMGPNVFKLKYEYCITDEKYIYQKVEYTKLLCEVRNLIDLLQKAIDTNQRVIHRGV